MSYLDDFDDGSTKKIRSKVPLQTVMASYTSNFEPSQFWDYNWDRLLFTVLLIIF